MFCMAWDSTWERTEGELGVLGIFTNKDHGKSIPPITLDDLEVKRESNTPNSLDRLTRKSTLSPISDRSVTQGMTRQGSAANILGSRHKETVTGTLASNILSSRCITYCGDKVSSRIV